MRRFSCLLWGCLLAFPVWPAQITAGPMLGHITARTAHIWLQGDGPGTIQIEYWPVQDPQQRQIAPAQALDARTDYSLHMELTGLKPETCYGYAVHLDDARADLGEGLVFTTPPMRSAQTPPANFTVYLGADAWLGDPDEEDAASPVADDYGLLTALTRAIRANPRPNFMIWLGDNVNFRAADYDSPWGMNARYRQSRSLVALRPLLRATNHYAVWDDHDYGPAAGNRGFVFKNDSLALFRRYWANPSYGLEELPGIFSRFGYQDADFFLLDDRYYRASDHTVEPSQDINWVREFKEWALGSNQLTRLLGRRYLGGGPAWLGENKTLFGAAQLDWLKQSLLNSPATFKVVVSGNPLFNDGNSGEGWQHFPGEREAFVEWLSLQKIPGLVFLSGGHQHTELIKRERKKNYPLYELSCSPLTASANLADAEQDNPQRLAGTLVTQRNYCSVDVVGPLGGRQLLLRAFNTDGKQLWVRQIEASELREPKRAEPQ